MDDPCMHTCGAVKQSETNPNKRAKLSTNRSLRCSPRSGLKIRGGVPAYKHCKPPIPEDPEDRCREQKHQRRHQTARHGNASGKSRCNCQNNLSPGNRFIAQTGAREPHAALDVNHYNG